MRIKILTLILCAMTLFCNKVTTVADDGYDLWLKFRKIENTDQLCDISSIVVTGQSQTCMTIQDELQKGMQRLFGKEISLEKSTIQDGSIIVGTPASSILIKGLISTTVLDTLGNEGFVIQSTLVQAKKVIVIAANNDIGLLYGAFQLLCYLQTHKNLNDIFCVSKPKIQLRLLNHWANRNGTVERGYAGKSLWKWDELPDTIDSRYQDYARANASIGINGTVINNVNASPEILKTEYIKKVAALAAVFRPWGIKTYLSINFSSPMVVSSGAVDTLGTSDPLNPKVRKWWQDKVKEIYEHIPDFGGFLVKANSEGMPGPQDHNRTHADGANMLAEALAPYHGIVMWRAFVYNAEVDADRAKRTYKEFVPLDGQFMSNVFVQAKNGPIDFQPREPVSPLFGAMPKTPLMLELQITQEYLGHSTHLVYLAPMWKEYFCFDTYAHGSGSTMARVVDGSLHDYAMTGIAGVSNIGDDRNWCGHLFAQANWYAYGRLAWNPDCSAEQIAADWIRMTFGDKDKVVEKILPMMMGSWEACVNYMTPLGLHHIMQEGFHYGPQPQHDRGRLDWTSVYYHRADSIGLGFNRRSTGSNAVAQYFHPLCDQFDNIDTCPEKYLLWFHHVLWTRPMKSGNTLWVELNQKYNQGISYVDDMAATWQSMQDDIDPQLFQHVTNKLNQQKADARTWRDVCMNYFQKFSRMAIVKE